MHHTAGGIWWEALYWWKAWNSGPLGAPGTHRNSGPARSTKLQLKNKHLNGLLQLRNIQRRRQLIRKTAVCAECSSWAVVADRSVSSRNDILAARSTPGDFKLNISMFKTLHGTARPHLSDEGQLVPDVSRRLRSCDRLYDTSSHAFEVPPFELQPEQGVYFSVQLPEPLLSYFEFRLCQIWMKFGQDRRRIKC